MANHRQAEKRHRQSLKRRAHNRHYKNTMRTLVKKVREAAERGDTGAASKLLDQAIRFIDRTAGKGIVEKNAAARTKSRLVKAVRRAG